MAWTKAKMGVVVGVGVGGLLLLGTANVALNAIQSRRNYPGLAGIWEGTNSSQHVALKIARTNGTYLATFDYIDSGIDIPASNFKPGKHAVSFGVAATGEEFTATIDPGMTQMSGGWRDGTNIYPVVLKHMAEPDITEPLAEADYTARGGSDLQGVWRGTVNAGGWQFAANLKIAEPAAGKCRAELDSVEWGGQHIPATSITREGNSVKIGFRLLGSFEGSLDTANGHLSGSWTRRDKTEPVTFSRVDLKAEEATRNYIPASPLDLQGHWKGTLKLPDGNLHFVFDIAQMPDGSLSATMDNPDQGAKNIQARTTQYTPPHVSILWFGTGGVFNGALANGKLTGTWKQGRTVSPLTLSRD
jgi:hypothetical protein